MLNHKVNRRLPDNAIHSDEQGENLIVLRYADILLMYAEAANEIGNSAEAIAKTQYGKSQGPQLCKNRLPERIHQF
jgi:hypothetical protein